MLLSPGSRIWLAATPVDMRLGFDGLTACNVPPFFRPNVPTYSRMRHGPCPGVFPGGHGPCGQRDRGLPGAAGGGDGTPSSGSERAHRLQ